MCNVDGSLINVLYYLYTSLRVDVFTFHLIIEVFFFFKKRGTPDVQHSSSGVPRHLSTLYDSVFDIHTTSEDV